MRTAADIRQIGPQRHCCSPSPPGHSLLVSIGSASEDKLDAVPQTPSYLALGRAGKWRGPWVEPSYLRLRQRRAQSSNSRTRDPLRYFLNRTCSDFIPLVSPHRARPRRSSSGPAASLLCRPLSRHLSQVKATARQTLCLEPWAPVLGAPCSGKAACKSRIFRPPLNPPRAHSEQTNSARPEAEPAHPPNPSTPSAPIGFSLLSQPWLSPHRSGPSSSSRRTKMACP